VNFAREKKKVAGEQRMKSERFSDLLQMHSSKGLDPMSPEFDEFKQMVLDREKRQNESAELNLKLQQMGLSNKKATLENQISSLMPQYGPEVNTPDGKVMRDRVDPQTGKLSQVTGTTKPLVEVNTGTKATEEAQKRFMDKVADNYEKLRDASVTLQNMEEAKALVPKAKYFMGPMGESWLEGVKFLNNRIGTNIKTDNVRSAEELRSRLATGVIDNLRKMDPTPAVKQMEMLEKAVGNLGTDPRAVESILDVFGDALRRKVEQHNQEVRGAKRVQFPFDPIINLKPKQSKERSLDDLLKKYGGK
jgi:hypothetical protein